ncbi:MAG: hypothetical protein ACKESB_02535 [Candidatus Hodgkinia cicadicola]
MRGGSGSGRRCVRAWVWEGMWVCVRGGWDALPGICRFAPESEILEFVRPTIR